MEKQRIVDAHNKVRQMIALGKIPGQPAATNMKEMIWDSELAVIAQRWADQCQFDHDTGKLPHSPPPHHHANYDLHSPPED